jgi:peptidyl-tRNA hydrolase, PTH1 family
MKKFLIAGLGNPGNEYAHTRHNIGYDVVNAFVMAHGGTWQEQRYAWQCTVKYKGKIFVCILPTTYMNLSGKAVRYWLDKEHIDIANMLVIVDELALPLDKIRLRGSGSDGGHNGLRDIQQVLQNTAYARLRFGIGNNYPKGMQADFVLGRWKPEEEPIVKNKITKCIEIIEQFALTGIEKTMSVYNNYSANPT